MMSNIFWQTRRETTIMALKIVESCVNCWACQPLCPSEAIYEAKPHFLIDPRKCTECEGVYVDPQCASICPIEGAILDSFGAAINPPGFPDRHPA